MHLGVFWPLTKRLFTGRMEERDTPPLPTASLNIQIDEEPPRWIERAGHAGCGSEYILSKSTHCSHVYLSEIEESALSSIKKTASSNNPTLLIALKIHPSET